MEFDSDCIVTGSAAAGGGEIQIWKDSKPSEELVLFHRDEAGKTVFSIAISTNGNYLAAGSQNGLIRVWLLSGLDILHPRPTLFEIYHSLSPVIAMAFLTDDLLLSAATNGKVQITSVSEAKHVGQIDAHRGAICSVVPLGSRVMASLGSDGIIKIWDMDSLHCEYQEQGFQFSREARLIMPSLAFCEKTGYLCCPSQDGRLHLFDLNSLCLHNVFEAHKGSFYAVASCGEYLATGGFKDRFVKLWDIKKKVLVSEFDTRASVIKLCPLVTNKIAALCIDSNGTGSIRRLTIPDLDQKIFEGNGSFFAITAFSPELCERISRGRLVKKKEGLIMQAQALLRYPEKMDPILQELTRLGFEAEAILLQADSSRIRNKPLHELKHLRQLTDHMEVSKETLPMFRRLSALLEQCNEPALAIEVLQRITCIDSKIEQDIERLKKYPVFNLVPATSIRLDLAHPALLAQEIEKNDVLKQRFRWSVILPSRDRRIFQVKFLHDLDSWERYLLEETIPKGRQIEMAREHVVLFDGKEGASAEWLVFSNVGLKAPSDDVFYALAVKKENGMTLGEGYGFFRPSVSGTSDVVSACNALVAERYRSLCAQKDTGEWLMRVHDIMINLDKQAHTKKR